ncbi:MAG: hypothetical protein FWE80_01815 [Oscillospiraceae bacterium]|nr:hypothetical protein [Oscillospiraceae bacterium]
MSNLKKLYWSLFFIAAAALVILHQLDKLGEITLLTLLATIIILPIIVESCRCGNFFGIFVPLGLVWVLYEKHFIAWLGIEKAIGFWPVILAAVFLSVGLQIIFHRKGKYKGKMKEKFEKHFGDGDFLNGTTEYNDDSDVNCRVSFGSGIKYLRSDELKKAYMKCSFGGLKVYFENATPAPEGAMVTVDVTCGGVELFIPRHWRIRNSVNAFAGGVVIKNPSRSTPEPDAPLLVLNGSIRMSGIEIILV